MNREEYLIKTFPLEDGTTYIENLDKSLALSLEKRIQIKSRRMKGINPLERRLAAIKEILSNYENIHFTFL